MPRDPVTGVYSRVDNSFSDPVLGEVIDPTAANDFWEDLTDALNDIPGDILTYTADATGAVERTIENRLNDRMSVIDFGADPTGVASSSAAFAAAHAAATYIYVPAGTYKLSTDQTWPTTATWKIDGLLSLDAGTDITCNSVIEAGIKQIFTGSGTIVGMRFNRPEWWGALNNGVHDDTSAITKALASAEASAASAGDRATVRLAGGSGYLVSSVITIAPSVNCPLDFGGTGNGLGGASRIVAKTAYAGNVVVNIAGSADALGQIMNFWVHDFGITAVDAVVNAVAMQIGSTGAVITGVNRSLIENITTTSLAIGLSFGEGSIRNIEIRRILVNLPDLTGAVGIFLNPSADTITVADCVWNDIQILCSIDPAVSGQSGMFFRTESGTGRFVGGHHIYNLTTYYAEYALRFESTDNNGSGDLWFYSPQLEGGSYPNGIHGVHMTAIGGAATRPQFANINFVDPWINSMLGKGFYATGSVAGTIQSLFQTGGYFANTADYSIELNNVRGASFSGFSLKANTAPTAPILLSGATELVSITGFNMYDGAATSYVVSITGTADKNTVIGAAAEGQYATAFANITSTGTANSVINLPGTVSNTGTGPLVRGTSPTLTTAVAAGIWTASGTWTLPAHTLGGTVSGGGNQINNVIIGTSTPLAGAFTTLSTTTTLTVGTTASLTATGATDNGLSIRSGGASNRTTLSIGRTAADGYFAAVANGNEYITGTAAGDVALLSGTTAKAVWIGNSADNAGIKVAGGAVTATSLNKVTVTAPATSATLTITDGQTLSYQEGTWTPAVIGSSTAGTGQTYSIQVGSYEKIGRQVTARFTIVLTSLGTAAGNVLISGFPFAPTSVTNDYASGYIGTYTVAGLAAGSTGISFYIQPATTTAVVAQHGGTTAGAITVTQLGATGTLVGTIIYRT